MNIKKHTLTTNDKQQYDYILRDYQESQVSRLVRQLIENRIASIVSATGSGKTLVASIVLSRLFNMLHVDKVIIATPFTNIVNAFEKNNGRLARNTAPVRTYTIGNIEKCEGTKNFMAKITNKDINIIVTTHHTLALTCDKIEKYTENHFSNMLLVIDESHHIDSNDENPEDANKIAQFVEHVRLNGGIVLYVTATPYREVNGKAIPIYDYATVNPVIRTIGQQMECGMAPELDLEYVYIKKFKGIVNEGIHKNDTVFGDYINSKISSSQMEIVIGDMLASWKKDGYPKCILLVPSGNSVKTAKLVKRYIERLKFPTNVIKMRNREHPSVKYILKLNTIMFIPIYVHENVHVKISQIHYIKNCYIKLLMNG